MPPKKINTSALQRSKTAMPTQKILANTDLSLLQKLRQSMRQPLVVILSILLFFTVSLGSVLAYQSLRQQIVRCSASSPTGSICFDLVGDKAGGTEKASIKNLDMTKKYRLVIKRKIDNNKSVEVGSVDFDLSKITSECKQYQQSSDSPNAACCTGLKLQHDLRNPSLVVCCRAGECAQYGTCAANGQIFPDISKKCNNGQWADWAAGPNDQCTDTDNGADYYKKGHINWPVQNFAADDYCRGDNLLEYYCEGGMYKEKSFVCPKGCQDGACLASGVAGGTQHAERCSADSECAAGLSCKYSGRYGQDGVYSERYCCTANECASVIPGTDPPVNCVGAGGTDVKDFVFGGIQLILTCQSGKYCVPYKGTNTTTANSSEQCCGSNVYKENLWYDPAAAPLQTCCAANECATFKDCVASGYIAPNDHKRCDNGSWVNEP